MAIVLSVLLWYTDSDYNIDIFWPLCCLFLYNIHILITPLVSFDHCVVCSSMIYRFWLPLGIFWPLCCLFFYDIQILITPLVSFGHCVVCSSMIYRFWVPPWYLLALCCLFFYDIQMLITPLVYFGHCVVCSPMIYRFWLHPWYLLAIVFSVLLWYTDSDYPLVIFWPLCCLFFCDIRILITPLISFGHCAVWSSIIYRFWLHPWYLLTIVLSVLLWYTDSDYPLVSFGHCVVCSSMIYRFWLHPWYLLVIVLSVLLWYTDSEYPLVSFGIVLSVLLWYTDSHYPLGIFWPLCCLFFYDIQILITPLVSFGHSVFCSSMIYRFWLHPWYILAIVLSVLLWYTDSDYTLGIFCPLCCLFLYDIHILITRLLSFGHCVVCASMIYRFWLHPWYLLAIVLSVLLWYTDYNYTLGIFWPLCCLFFYDIQILITPLVSFGNCVVCSSMIYRFWLLPWYLLAIVLSVLLWYTDSNYTLGIFWPLCCLFFYDIQILITPLVSFGHCVVCSSMINGFDYPLGIFWPLCCLFFYDIQILITRLISFGHCAVCSSIIYRFWLHPWYVVAIVLSVLLWYTDSDYTLGIFWPLCCLFFCDIQILITPLVSFGHCVVCSSVIYRFWLHPWYRLAIVLSVLLWYTDSDYTLGIFWPLCCLFFYNIQIIITPLVSFGHCVVCSSMISRF